VVPESVVPESVAPESVAPESVAPESVAPESVAPASGPESAVPESLDPESIRLESAAPESTTGGVALHTGTSSQVPRAVGLGLGLQQSRLPEQSSCSTHVAPFPPSQAKRRDDASRAKPRSGRRCEVKGFSMGRRSIAPPWAAIQPTESRDAWLDLV
jgi:hypothetical protein